MDKKLNFIRLLDNHIYPTYQLYAVMNNRKTDVYDGMRIAALTVTEWLRQRIGSNIPAELQLPEPEKYASVSLSDLKPMHLNRGYTVDITTLPEGDNAFWSLQITEPDLGPNPGAAQQSRSAVPGRVIETNIGFLISDGELQCGFQTVISDPEGAEPAEVYRLAVVRRLLENPLFGLRQILPLQDKPTHLDTAASVRKLAALMEDSSNQLPSVVFTYHTPEKEKPEQNLSAQPIGEAIAGFAAMPRNAFSTVTEKVIAIDMPKTEIKGKKIPIEPGNVKKPERAATVTKVVGKGPAEKYELLFNANEFARHNKACCRTYILGAEMLEVFKKESGLQLRAGDIAVLYPKKHGVENEIIKCTPSDSVRERRLNALSGKIYAYPRDKEYNFGKIRFQAEAKDSIYEAHRLASRKNKDITETNRIQLEQLRTEYTAKLSEKEADIERLQRQLNTYYAEEERWKLEKEKLELEHKRDILLLQQQISDRDEKLNAVRRRKEYPSQLTDVAQWARKKYSDHLVMHERTDRTLADSGSQVSLETLCDALDFLANDYWEYHFGIIDETEMNRRCHLKYDRPFDVRPVGDLTVEFAPHEYKVKYLMTGTAKRREYPLNMHLASGNTAPWLLRIYFFFDDAGEKLVIGSLPDHLKNLTVN